jgi:hypothetical protein
VTPAITSGQIADNRGLSSALSFRQKQTFCILQIAKPEFVAQAAGETRGSGIDVGIRHRRRTAEAAGKAAIVANGQYYRFAFCSSSAAPTNVGKAGCEDDLILNRKRQPCARVRQIRRLYPGLARPDKAISYAANDRARRRSASPQRLPPAGRTQVGCSVPSAPRSFSLVREYRRQPRLMVTLPSRLQA